jgi:hypothetical protein
VKETTMARFVIVETERGPVGINPDRVVKVSGSTGGNFVHIDSETLGWRVPGSVASVCAQLAEMGPSSPTLTRAKAKSAVVSILNDATDRRGIRQALDALDPATRAELVAEWEDAVVAAFES